MSKNLLREPILTLNDLKPGDILLCPPAKLPDGWVGQAIVLLTNGEVSHSAIYIGEINGEKYISDSCPNQISTAPLKVLLESEPGCYVKRHHNKTNFTPVLEAVTKYADHENPYPFFNLGVLGLLLLTKHFSKDTFTSHIFYEFALLVAIKLMEVVEDTKYKGKKPMSCSQFTAQCFTDAGNEYDIKFDDLIIKFNNKTNKSSIINSNENGTNTETMSLLDLVGSGTPIQGGKIDEELKEKILKNKHKIATNFVNLMNGNSVNSSATTPISKEKLRQISYILSNCFPDAQSNYATLLKQHDTSKLSTLRNYFVTPDDLHIYSKNLDSIGYIIGNSSLDNFSIWKLISRICSKIISFIKKLFS